MPLPLFIGIGIAAVTAATGVGKGIHAGVQINKAKDLNKTARSIYEDAVTNLEKARDKSKEALETLGRTKLDILNGTINNFVTAFEKIHNIDFEESTGLNELKKYKLDKQSFLQMKEMSALAVSMSVAEGTVAGGTTGALMAFGAYGLVATLGTASTGTAIATLSGVAATNATLAFLGGGTLAVGGLGMAGGMAILGGIVAGPALAVLGIFMDAKASKNLDNAYSNLAEAKKINQELQLAATVCKGIEKRGEMYTYFLLRLDELLKPLIPKIEATIDIMGTDFIEYTEASKETIGVAYSIANAIKLVLDTPILTIKGELTNESERVAQEVKKFLSEGI